MNKNQKIVLAIFLPLVLLVASYGLSNVLLDKKCPYPVNQLSELETSYGYMPMCSVYKLSNPGAVKDVSAFDFEDTWFIWGFALILISIGEYKLFGDKKN